MSNSKQLDQELLLSTKVGNFVYTDVRETSPLVTRKVFIDSNKNLLSFNNSIPKFFESEDRLVTFWEVGFFIEALYLGNVKCFELFFLQEREYDFVDDRFVQIHEVSDCFITRKLVTSYLETARAHRKELLKRDSITKVCYQEQDHTVLKRAEYNSESAFKCMLNLKIGLELVTEGKLVKNWDNRQLIALENGLFSKKTVVKELDKNIKKLFRKLEKSSLPLYTEEEKLNDLLLSIRNVK